MRFWRKAAVRRAIVKLRTLATRAEQADADLANQLRRMADELSVHSDSDMSSDLPTGENKVEQVDKKNLTEKTEVDGQKQEETKDEMASSMGHVAEPVV